jgi:hydrogenase expression/formation protein HypC
MCLAVPARLLSISHTEGIVDLHGTRVRVSTALVPDVLPGDWVLVHAGFAIQRLEPQDVAEVWTNLAALQAEPPPDPSGLNSSQTGTGGRP